MNLDDDKPNESEMETLLDENFDINVYSKSVHSFKCEKCKENSNYGIK